jgi:hypothetical protein
MQIGLVVDYADLSKYKLDKAAARRVTQQGSHSARIAA